MKHSSILFIITLLTLMGCNQSKINNKDILTVDIIDGNFPEKELIIQDFMNVEYITLETRDSFINQGFVQDIGKNIILIINRNRDGDIFVYDRAGKALRKINRKGQGGEEYTNIVGITLDEENNEMFVNNHLARKIQVYDLHGNFKRSIKLQEGVGTFYTDILNYDKEMLICYSKYNRDGKFVLISKQNGSISKEIKIPFKEKRLLQTEDGSASPGYYPSIIPYKGNWILLEHSSDTVYSFSSNYKLHPFLVRTPSIQSMEQGIFLIFRLLSDRYYFMETIKNVYDFEKGKGFPRTFLMYDKAEKAFFKYKIYNGDYLVKREMHLNTLRSVNHEIESLQLLESNQLVEAYEKGELKGKLREIAVTLNEDSNPVIMLIKHND